MIGNIFLQNIYLVGNAYMKDERHILEGLIILLNYVPWKQANNNFLTYSQGFFILDPWQHTCFFISLDIIKIFI